MLPDRIFSTFQTASQGLAVQREKIAAASRNIANANTSAPAGSNRVYRPQTVSAFSPSPQKFQRVLRDSLSTLKETDPKHITTPGLSSDQRGNAPYAMGPQFEVAESDRFRFEYDPNHPDADENGMVRYPDVDLVQEMTQMVSANRLYEANLSSIQAEKEIIKRSLDI